MRYSRIPAALAMCSLLAGAADLTPAERRLNVDSFDYAWNTIRKFMWQPFSVDWQKVHDELRPKVEAAATMDDARSVMSDMISRLNMTHFGIVPGGVYEHLDPAKIHKGGGGSAGFELRILDGQATVVTVESDAPVYAAGIRPGWRAVEAGGVNLGDLIARLQADLHPTTVRNLLITRAVIATFEGSPGTKVRAAFLDGAGRPVRIDVQLTQSRGAGAKIGFLPEQHVWYESRRIGNTGYIRFNMFLDPARISTKFGDSVESCMHCDGIVIDLRGNPGGIGGMALGMAGWFIGKDDVRLGVMKMKDTELKFVVNPRPEVYRGPVAILVDDLTASTSEIFASGLKDLGRARIFGTRTAGAALPSAFERLPNGDGFQYAMANYVSEGGQPLEGIGVVPDVVTPLTREALLAGQDPALEAALAWVHAERQNHQEKDK
jgi:carboxyl-terminal processing protease